MDNLETAPYKLFEYPEEINGDITHSSVEDTASCFLTNASLLIYREYTSNNFTSVTLEDEIANNAIQLKCLAVWKLVYLATERDLILIDPKSERVTVLKSFPHRITQTSWNPTETFLLVVTENNTIYGYTFEYNAVDNIYRFVETHESNIDEAVPNSVYVGWGSQNTQFNGAVKKEEVKVEEIAQDYSPPVISWRGNGEQFIVNVWRNYRRILKLFDANLNALFESSPYPNLMPFTSFKGQGNFIACVARQGEDSNKIIVFEKNCRIKSEFLIPENKGEVMNLLYHPELPILAIHSEDLECAYLNIYLYSNAKWFLKQQILYREDEKLKAIGWTCYLNKSICTLDVITSKSISRYLFKFVINRYPEYGIVAVTDGPKVYVTNFSEQIIPPPMHGICINFAKPINQILFDGTLGLFQFVTSEGVLCHYHFKDGVFTPHCAADYPDLRLTVTNPSRPDTVYAAEVKIRNLKFDLYLDRQQDLIISGRVVCNNVLSMYVHDKYLLFTHASCKLFCVRLTHEVLITPHWDLNEFYSRDVEQGTKIVCITSHSSVVMEEPRGNLETITCRVIAIDIVEAFLKENDWANALHYIRHQRLNWNLLIDLDPHRFYHHIKDFIKATKTVALLNTIVCEFSAENCLLTLYRTCVEPAQIHTGYNKTAIFVNILNELHALNPVLNLVSIVTLQAKHFSLKSALVSVMAVFLNGVIEMCKKALLAICLHKNANEVVQESFALYSTNFMTFVYTCLGEDPRSFEPQLRRLDELDEVERRYQMNVLGKHYREASKYLLRVNAFDEEFITEFVNKHSTQNVAYASVNTKHEKHVLISQLYAIFLSQRNRHDEAALILERAELYELAIHEHKYALNWQRVVSLLEELKFDDAKRTEILADTASVLLNRNQIDNAVVVLDSYLGRYDRAIAVLTQKKLFQKALNLAQKYSCHDLIEDVIKPSVVEYRSELLEKIMELAANFATLSSRLYLLRQEKLRALTAIQVDDDDDDDIDDMESEYGSIVSRGSATSSRASGSSTASARNRRKQERKKTDLREGAQFEDIAIIRQLYVHTIEIFKMGPDVRGVCLTLTDDDSFNFSIVLQKKLSDLQEMVIANVPKIWSQVFLHGQTCGDPMIMSVIMNRDELDEQFRVPPPRNLFNDDWKLLIFDSTT